MSDHVHTRVRWRASEFARVFGLSRTTAWEMRRRHGWKGRWIYSSQVRRQERDLWESYVLTLIAKRTG